MFLYHYFKEWYKNPHWSFSCCVDLLLPLNDLQGEIHNLVETSLHKTQLQTGHVDNPNGLSGAALDFALEGDRQDGVETVKKEDEYYKDYEYSVTRHHRGTQTELCSKDHFVAQELPTESHKKLL